MAAADVEAQRDAVIVVEQSGCGVQWVFDGEAGMCTGEVGRMRGEDGEPGMIDRNKNKILT